MTAWATVADARIHWKVGAAVTDPQMTDLLTAAQETLTAWAPALPPDPAPPAPPTPIPFRYKLACIYQAREIYNAGQRDNDTLGTEGFVIRARPITGTVKALLRPPGVSWSPQ